MRFSITGSFYGMFWIKLLFLLVEQRVSLFSFCLPPVSAISFLPLFTRFSRFPLCTASFSFFSSPLPFLILLSSPFINLASRILFHRLFLIFLLLSRYLFHIPPPFSFSFVPLIPCFILSHSYKRFTSPCLVFYLVLVLYQCLLSRHPSKTNVYDPVLAVYPSFIFFLPPPPYIISSLSNPLHSFFYTLF